MDEKVTAAREKLLDAIIRYTGQPDEKSASCVRNWATAYGILTDKFLSQNRAA